jgi:hypothetical protein
LDRRSLFGDLSDGAIALFLFLVNRRSLFGDLSDGAIAFFIFSE